MTALIVGTSWVLPSAEAVRAEPRPADRPGIHAPLYLLKAMQTTSTERGPVTGEAAADPLVAAAGARVHAVIVAYNSADTIRACVTPLLAAGAHVTVVDNASPDDTAAALAGLGVDLLRAAGNDGFAAGCNLGAPRGDAPYVLLLNPDATIGDAGLAALVAVLDDDPHAGIAAPRIIEDDGSLAFSQRRFPRLRSTYAQALFAHRLLPNAPWTDEVIRDDAAYATPGSPDWVSGACMLIRRSALERLGGLDDAFFLYGEDIDVCARVREAGWDVRFEPAAVARHTGGASRPSEELLPVLAASRVLYARKHPRGRLAVALETAGIALGHSTHALTSIRRPAVRRGHMAAFKAALGAPADPRTKGSR